MGFTLRVLKYLDPEEAELTGEETKEHLVVDLSDTQSREEAASILCGIIESTSEEEDEPQDGDIIFEFDDNGELKEDEPPDPLEQEDIRQTIIDEGRYDNGQFIFLLEENKDSDVGDSKGDSRCIGTN